MAGIPLEFRRRRHIIFALRDGVVKEREAGERLEGGAHDGFVADDLLGPGADALGGVVKPAVGLDHPMAIGHQLRQVGIARGEFEGHHVARDRLFGYPLHGAQRAGLRFFVPVSLDGGDLIIGGQGLAVVKLHPRAADALAATQPALGCALQKVVQFGVQGGLADNGVFFDWKISNR